MRAGLLFLPRRNDEVVENRMEAMTCFAGGMFALGSMGQESQRTSNWFLSLATYLTNTCHESYIRTATHLGPEIFHFTHDFEGIGLQKDHMSYRLRGDVVESYFYLWRLTHDQRYRDYAWDVVQAIDKYCRTDSGFVGLMNTSDVNSRKIDKMETYFMSKTLKYLYLIFSSDDLIPLNEWVFNTEGHPIPIDSKFKAECKFEARTTEKVLNQLKLHN